MNLLDQHNAEEIFQCQDCKAIYFSEQLSRIRLDGEVITYCRGCGLRNIVLIEEEK